METGHKGTGYPALIATVVAGWWRSPDRGLYAHKSGAIAVRLNPSTCRDCLKKYQVRLPNLTAGSRVIRAGASLEGEPLDRFIAGRVEAELRATPIDPGVAPPAKLCPQCGELATLLGPCKCGNKITDREGFALVNVTRIHQSDRGWFAFLCMSGYPQIRLELTRKGTPALDWIKIRGAGENDTITIRIDGEAVKRQITLALVEAEP